MFFSSVTHWFLSLDWSWLFGHDVQFAVEILFGRFVVSVTGNADGERYAEVALDAITSPGGVSKSIEVGLTTQGVTPASPRSGLSIATDGRIWLNGAPFASPTFSDGPTFNAADVVMFFLKLASGKAWVGKVGAGWYNGGDPAADTGETGVLPAGTYYIGAGINRLSDEPDGGAQFSLRTQESQFTGVVPVGGIPWYGTSLPVVSAPSLDFSIAGNSQYLALISVGGM